MRVTQNQHQHGDVCLRYRHVEGGNPNGPRLLCLHGAGVAGELTWGGIVPELECAREVLVPDLYGAGDTHHQQGEQPFSTEQLLDHLRQWLNQMDWSEFCIAGYSFGGHLAMRLSADGHFSVPKQVLIEPALMERLDWSETLHRRRLYTQATEPLKTSADPAEGVRAFLDLVSPGRSTHPRVERRVVSRLAHRPVGLAHALEAISATAETLDRAQLISAQPLTLSIVGGKTPEPAHQLHQHLASQHPGWRYTSVVGCDHALPYQKPAAVGRLMAEFLSTDFD